MAKLSISDLDRELRNKQLRPVYLIHGAETHLANTALSRIKNYISKLTEGGVETDRFSGKSSNPTDIIACAGTVPMWVTHRFVIVDDADGIKESDMFEVYFKKPSKTTTIVFLAGKMDGRTRFFQLLSEVGAVIECKPLYDDKVPDWIRMEASRLGKTISMDATRLIFELVGNSLGELFGAMEKIDLYVGKKSTIDVEDVEAVLTETSRKDVFELTEAVGKRDIFSAMRILERLSEFDENEVMILSMLARHFRLLAKARELISGNYDKFALAKGLGVNPFFVETYAGQSKLFTVRELKESFKKLYAADKKLKSSRLPKQAILEKCIRELC